MTMTMTDTTTPARQYLIYVRGGSTWEVSARWSDASAPVLLRAQGSGEWRESGYQVADFRHNVYDREVWCWDRGFGADVADVDDLIVIDPDDAEDAERLSDWRSRA